MDSAPQLVTISVSFTSLVMVRTKTTRNLIMPMEKNFFTCYIGVDGVERRYRYIEGVRSKGQKAS